MGENKKKNKRKENLNFWFEDVGLIVRLCDNTSITNWRRDRLNTIQQMPSRGWSVKRQTRAENLNLKEEKVLHAPWKEKWPWDSDHKVKEARPLRSRAEPSGTVRAALLHSLIHYFHSFVFCFLVTMYQSMQERDKRATLVVPTRETFARLRSLVSSAPNTTEWNFMSPLYQYILVVFLYTHTHTNEDE